MLSPTATMIASSTSVLLSLTYNIYLFCALALHTLPKQGRQTRIANILWHWTKWPALAFIITNPILTLLIFGHLKWWTVPYDLFAYYIWWRCRNAGDDDDHKKLQRKLKDTVTVIAGKLVVVPRPA